MTKMTSVCVARDSTTFGHSRQREESRVGRHEVLRG
jgi:hypothetical protein